MSNFSGVIKKIRLDRGLTQDEFSKELNVTRQTLSRWETNRSYPNLDTLVSISNSFNVSLDFLLKGEHNIMVEKISNDVRSKNKYKAWLLGIITLLLFICGIAGFFMYGYFKQVAEIDYIDPFLKTKIGYAVLPKYNYKEETKNSMPKVDVFVADDPFGSGEWLNIYTGEYNFKKQVAEVEHKGSYAKVSIIDKKDVPKQMKQQVSSKYVPYNAKSGEPRIESTR